MASESPDRYEEFYRARDGRYVYPVEFVVRAFLGAYPNLPRRGVPQPGARILDIGFGDGRNMPLLSQLGFDVHGVEISEDICARTVARLQSLGIAVDARVGRNASLPFADAFFDDVLACHSCYYVDPGTTFMDNVREVSRVLKPGGRFVFSVPIDTSYIMKGARDLGRGLMEIAEDPYGVRQGVLLQKFDSADDIVRALGSLFDRFSIGSCRNDFWGIDEHVWTVVCHRRAVNDGSHVHA